MLPTRRQSSRRRRVLAAAVVAAALPALSGCASNFDSPVLQKYDPSVGVDVRKGGVWGMNMLVVLPEEGGEGTLVGGLLNKSPGTDRLVAASLRVEPGEGESALRSTLERPLTLQPGRLHEMSDPTTVAVEGDVLPGRFVDLTLRFARSRAIHTKVPVMPPEGPYAQVPLPSAGGSSAAETTEPTEGTTAGESPSPSQSGTESETEAPAQGGKSRSSGAGG